MMVLSSVGCAHRPSTTDTPPAASTNEVTSSGPFGQTPRASNLLTVATIDVGQGFCVLILCPSPSRPILYDCGSSGATIMGPHQKEYAADKILNAVISAGAVDPNTGVATLGALVTSHSDKDHYNLLPFVAPLSGTSNQGVTFAYQRILYSGVLTDYTENDYVQKVAATPNIVSVLPTAGAEYHTGRASGQSAPLVDNIWPVETRLECGDPNKGQYATVLSVNTINPSKPNDPNPRSVVLRVQNGANSVILGGDAEIATYQSIYRAYQLTSVPSPSNPAGFDSPALNTTLLLAPHHGAITNESADGLWAYLVNPRTVVFSAGLYQQYFHPQCETLDTYINDPGPPYVHNNTGWRLAMSGQIGACGGNTACAQFYSRRANYPTSIFPLNNTLPLCCGASGQRAYTIQSSAQAAFSTWINGSIYMQIPASGPPMPFCPDSMNGTGDCGLPRVQFTEGVQCVR